MAKRVGFPSFPFPAMHIGLPPIPSGAHKIIQSERNGCYAPKTIVLRIRE